MAKFYATQIRLKRMTIEEVPERWREATKALLQQ